MDWDPKEAPVPWDIISDVHVELTRPLDLKLNSTGISSTITATGAKRQKKGQHVVAVRCLVEGCKAELSKSREYHRRHKVCELHSKTALVIVSGREQRFCQQCSRFHLLGEFDDAKRSCRKRLEGHNRRRRKPQSDNLSARGLLGNHQGSRFGAFPPIFPSIRTESCNWAVKSEPVSISTALYPCIQSYTKPRHQFPFLNDTTSDINFRSTFTSLPVEPASDCALSLLSSPVQSSSSVVTTGTATNRIPMAQPLLSGFQFGASNGITSANGFTETRVMSSFGISSSGGTGELNSFQGLFQVGAGEGTSQSLPFSWQ